MYWPRSSGASRRTIFSPQTNWRENHGLNRARPLGSSLGYTRFPKCIHTSTPASCATGGSTKTKPSSKRLAAATFGRRSATPTTTAIRSTNSCARSRRATSSSPSIELASAHSASPNRSATSARSLRSSARRDRTGRTSVGRSMSASRRCRTRSGPPITCSFCGRYCLAGTRRCKRTAADYRASTSPASTQRSPRRC